MRIRPSKERLRPGGKLGEANLPKAFGTTRIHIRQMPAHLASRCIVTQYVTRAAFVIRPAVEGAHKVIAPAMSWRWQLSLAQLTASTPPPGATIFQNLGIAPLGAQEG